MLRLVHVSMKEREREREREREGGGGRQTDREWHTEKQTNRRTEGKQD